MDDNLPYWRKPVVRVDQVDPLDEPLKNFDPPHANGAPPSHLDQTATTPEPDPLGDEAAPADDRRGTPSSPQARVSSPPLSVTMAERLLGESHMRMRNATHAQQVAHGKVATTLAAWQRLTMRAQTPADLIRQHLASETQLRADRKAGKIPPRGGQRRLGSAVDAYAYYTRASGKGAGGGRAFARGAKPVSRRTPKW